MVQEVIAGLIYMAKDSVPDTDAGIGDQTGDEAVDSVPDPDAGIG